VSEQGVLGPYLRQDYIYDNNGSHKGHNVTALELPDGTYAVVVSETVPFTIYTSSSLDGPWTSCTPAIEVSSSNVSLFPRHDGRYQVVERYGNIAISDTLCGTYVKQTPTCSYPTDNGDTIYPTRNSIPGVSNPTFDWQEDPHIWRSGGTYHVIYSGSGDRVGWHLYSADGINDWQDNGYGWSPREYERLFCFEGSDTCNQWYKMERPGVVLEDGHPTHITWAVSDVDKDNQIPGNSNHGSKIIVVPFDGVQFDVDFGDGTTVPTTGAGGTGGTGGVGGAGTDGAATSGSAGMGGAQVTGGVSSTDGISVGGATMTGGTAETTGGAISTSGIATTTGGAMSPTGGTMSGATSVGATSGSGGMFTTDGTIDPMDATPSPDDSGCSCRAAGARSSSNGWALLGMMGLLGMRARRRRRVC
jgi:MYXO-CTERM domain-containing protein